MKRLNKNEKPDNFDAMTMRSSNMSMLADQSEGPVPFPLKFLNSLSVYMVSNSRNKKLALIEMYEL